MKKFAIFLVTLLVLGCFVSTASASDDGVTISKASVLAKEGEVVQITAVGNPTTGYVWSEPKLSNGLTLVLSDYTQLKPGMIGKGGIFEWWTAADKPGFYLFETDYARMSGSPIKTLQTVIIIVPDVLNIPSGLISYYEL